MTMRSSRIAILSTNNLIHNLMVLKSRACNAKVIAMVKANAYGHGIRSVSKRLEEYVDSFGVASIDEAMILRQIGIGKPITLVQGVLSREDMLIASENEFHVVVRDSIQIDWIKNLDANDNRKPILCWLKINTGMGRLGFSTKEAMVAYRSLKELEQENRISILGIMSHFACADDPMNPMNMSQIEKFQMVVGELKGMYPDADILISMANSAAIFNFEQVIYDVIRPGIALYGISPVVDVSAFDLDLRPVMTLQSSIISIRSYEKGECIGYGGDYTCKSDTIVGVVAIGYGDGYPRTAQTGTPVLVNGVLCPLVGRVSMDMITVDLKKALRAQVGDVVTLWGEGLPIETVAKYTQNIPYDMLTAVQQRVKFYWE